MFGFKILHTLQRQCHLVLREELFHHETVFTYTKTDKKIIDLYKHRIDVYTIRLFGLHFYSKYKFIINSFTASLNESMNN